MSRSNRFHGPSPLGDTASGRVSMPFLPTLGVVVVLGAASFLCPAPRIETKAQAIADTPLETAALTPPFGQNMSFGDTRRMTATLAFAEAYPLPSSRPAAESRTTATRARARLVAARRPCSGRRCPEAGQVTASTAVSAPDPFVSIRTADGTRRGSDPAGTPETLPPARARPFAETVAVVVGPTARVVGTAANFVREGAAGVSGAVSGAVSDAVVDAVTGTLSRSTTLLAECLR